jgi:hypothetical protein
MQVQVAAKAYIENKRQDKTRQDSILGPCKKLSYEQACYMCMRPVDDGSACDVCGRPASPVLYLINCTIFGIILVITYLARHVDGNKLLT